MHSLRNGLVLVLSFKFIQTCEYWEIFKWVISKTKSRQQGQDTKGRSLRLKSHSMRPEGPKVEAEAGYGFGGGTVSPPPIQWVNEMYSKSQSYAVGYCQIRSRACLDQLLIAIRSLTLLCDHSRSKTTLITIVNVIAKLEIIYATACYASLGTTALGCLPICVSVVTAAALPYTNTARGESAAVAGTLGLCNVLCCLPSCHLAETLAALPTILC